jgi:hypothetical protein
METFLRLRELESGTYFVVDMAAGIAYAETLDEGTIADSNEHGGIAQRALLSARHYDSLFELPVPGNTTPDGKFEVRGGLTRAERKDFAEGRRVAAERAALLLHLDFFDRDSDGKISVGENYAGWRRLGFSKLAAAAKAVSSAAIFGRILAGFAIDIERIGAKRYARGTGIYDHAGRINHARLDEYCAAFAQRKRPLTFDETMALLENNSAPGFLSRGQFKSLFSVCERLNKGAKVVTEAQFRGLFDGSLLWLAASTSNDAGRRAHPASAPD